MKSNDVFSADRKFFGIYDNTEGVVPGTPVTINGFQVGSVESIELLNPSAKILVTFRIENKFSISNNGPLFRMTSANMNWGYNFSSKNNKNKERNQQSNIPCNH